MSSPSFLSLQVTLAQQQQEMMIHEASQQQTSNTNNQFFLQISALVCDANTKTRVEKELMRDEEENNNKNDKEDTNTNNNNQEEASLSSLVSRPPKGFTKFHRVGPLARQNNGQQQQQQSQHSFACAVPLYFDQHKHLLTDIGNNSSNHTAVVEQQQQQGNDENKQPNDQTTKEAEVLDPTLETIIFKIELVEVFINPETGKAEKEAFVGGQPAITIRKFPSSFLQQHQQQHHANNLVLDLLPIEMNLGNLSSSSANHDENEDNNNNSTEIALQLRLRNLTTLFESPLASIVDPGPPRLRFIGNLPKLRQTRKILRKLYGFSHLSSVAYHTLQYTLQMTNTPNESGNVIFGPKRLVALEHSIARGWGGVQPLFRFALMKRLDVSNTFFGDVGFSVILSVVHFCQRIEELNISKCGFTSRSVPLIVQTLMNHDGIEAIDISCNDLMEVSGEDLLRLPRNNLRITTIDASGNAFSKYVMTRLAKYCNDNLNTFNQDPLNPFGLSCSYLRDVRDIPSENWNMVNELWLALTTLYSSKKDQGKPDEHGDLLLMVSTKRKRRNSRGEEIEVEEETEEEVDPEGEHLKRNAVVDEDDNSNNNNGNTAGEFLIPPVATAPLLSLVWWRAFEQLINKIEDPMVLLTFAPLAKPTVTRRDIPVDLAKEVKKEKEETNENENENDQQQQQQEEDEEKATISDDDQEGGFITAGPQSEEEKEALREMDEINDLLRHKAKQQFETTLLRAFVVAVPFAERSWHHVEGALIRIGDSLRSLGVSMVDLRRFHLALINALKIEIGENGFDTQHQTAWVQVSSLIFRTLMDM